MARTSCKQLKNHSNHRQLHTFPEACSEQHCVHMMNFRCGETNTTRTVVCEDVKTSCKLLSAPQRPASPHSKQCKLMHLPKTLHHTCHLLNELQDHLHIFLQIVGIWTVQPAPEQTEAGNNLPEMSPPPKVPPFSQSPFQSPVPMLQGTTGEQTFLDTRKDEHEEPDRPPQINNSTDANRAEQHHESVQTSERRRRELAVNSTQPG